MRRKEVEQSQKKIHKNNAFISVSSICNFVFSFITKLVTVVRLSLFIMSTYPMKHWCILQKYISRPLLLLQLVLCHHIVSEMYLQPSRPQMHANNASRRNSRFVPQGTASLLKSSSNFCYFPLLRSLNLNKRRKKNFLRLKALMNNVNTEHIVFSSKI